ncbi:MAG: PqqD family protein [Rhodospirillaceae bacterium]|nr:PqqD family protein [Rhodospirillaceae bacterium]
MNDDIMRDIILRHPQTIFREVDEDIFLVHPDGTTIYNLNPTAAAIWRLMDQPIEEALNGEEMAEVLSAAFPVISLERLQTDVKNVLSELLNEGFALKQ